MNLKPRFVIYPYLSLSPTPSASFSPSPVCLSLSVSFFCLSVCLSALCVCVYFSRSSQSHTCTICESMKKLLACFWSFYGQVSQLRVENSTLLKRLTDINQKFNEAAVNNRILKADVETWRAKVNKSFDIA